MIADGYPVGKLLRPRHELSGPRQLEGQQNVATMVPVP